MDSVMTTPEQRATAFREVMAGVCTPVSVVTAMDGDRPHGTTVSAFASLSLNPPMVLVALDRASELLALVRRSDRFGVNVLADGQSALAKQFARKGSAKFHGVRWCPAGGLPRLDGASGWLACEVSGLVDGGDHVIAIGAILDADARGTAPLTYHQRRFGTHTAFRGQP
ncbi:flavin reductase family protein [Saccharopolyspora sp. TS4A08]|uniref:Flavin reductase family protein n=1 Tax=Saccharopolyspora ipomoeae TaxID=3042027 RepID=A0ABT6PR57_9PSEU|nr:flavin reductase family protein [Saccharopolyspora sp. TS4A08]MDI2030496.1 flavin reductase family protein [Saccharopolyspora sp. TS4A08]